MLLLTSTSDQLQIVTDVAGTVDVHTTWVDTIPSTGSITPGRNNNTITTATTLSIAGSPLASTQRNVKTIHVRNKNATVSSNLTVRHTDGTNIVVLYADLFKPGQGFEYTDQGGFLRV
jgi:hypothetical protein